MKTYYARPNTEVRIVRPDRNDLAWEFWVLVPQRIGGGKRLGTRRIKSDNDGHEYQNLAEILIEDLEAHGFKDLAADMRAGEEIKTITVSGMELAANGRWPVFCAMRRIDPKDVKAIQQSYALTPVEAKQLEIAG